jgi:hypothetical protein
MAMHGHNERRVKIVLEVEVTEQAPSFKYLG